MDGSVNDLVLLWKDLYFENDLFQERSQELTWHLSNFSVIFSKLEVDSISLDFELLDISETMLSLFSNIGSDPVWLNRLLALVVDEGATKFEACAYIIVTLNRNL